MAGQRRDHPGIIEYVEALNDDELAMDANLVRRLVAHSLPTYAGAPVCREALRACEEISDLRLDLGRTLRVWDRAIAEERTSPATDSWVHVDLLAEDLLVRDGALAAAVLAEG